MKTSRWQDSPAMQGAPKVFISSTIEDLKPYRDAANMGALDVGGGQESG